MTIGDVSDGGLGISRCIIGGKFLPSPSIGLDAEELVMTLLPFKTADMPLADESLSRGRFTLPATPPGIDTLLFAVLDRIFGLFIAPGAFWPLTDDNEDKDIGTLFPVVICDKDMTPPGRPTEAPIGPIGLPLVMLPNLLLLLLL